MRMDHSTTTWGCEEHRLDVRAARRVNAALRTWSAAGEWLAYTLALALCASCLLITLFGSFEQLSFDDGTPNVCSMNSNGEITHVQ